ncbi:MAG: hypothetical protein AAF203_02695 [Pseudomonadota bacterium]
MNQPIPGDDAVPSATWICDQSIMIKGTPENIWPWLAQMGSGRAGWYSWDWIDNWGRPSFQNIDSNLQTLSKDQAISVFTLDDFKENQFMTLRYSKKANMTWWLEPRGEKTKLSSRVRINGPKLLLDLTLGPGHFIMQYKQFVEIKKRVERMQS